MNKKIYLTFLLVAVLLIGCEEENLINNIKNDSDESDKNSLESVNNSSNMNDTNTSAKDKEVVNPNISLGAFQELSNIKIGIDYYKTLDKFGGNIGDYVISNDELFYIVNYEIPMTNWAERSLVVHNSSEEVKILYDTQVQDSNFVVNELRATDDYIYWVKEEPMTSWEIYRYDKKKGEVKVIRDSECSSSKLLPCLEAKDSYVVWYEVENDTLNNARLIIYNDKLDQLTLIEDVILVSPYSRAYIREGNLTYRTRKDYTVIVNVHNLSTDSTESYDLSMGKAACVYSNSSYIIWHKDYGESDIYFFNRMTNDQGILKHTDLEYRLFSVDLIGDDIIINDRNRNKLIIYNIENNVYSNLINNKKNEEVYVLDRVSDETKYSFVAKTREYRYIGVVSME